jgi:methylenetetrahydrofolate dehydrogenase (NADP+) / methenyltetrahydrofolate cyclohydrolase
MTAEPIDGRAVAAELRARVAEAAARLPRPPGLTVVIAGDDPASRIYVRSKGKAAREAGFRSDEIRLSAGASEDEVLALVRRLNGDEAVDGILVQLPLPKQVDPLKVIDAIDPAKDVDGFHVENAGRLAVGLPCLIPCTPLGCLILLKRRLPSLAGLNALVIGRSNIVGKPMAQLLLAENATVTVAHSRTADLAAECRRADVLVAAVGRPLLVKGSWLKAGATVIDVGQNRLPDGRLVGDVDYSDALAVAGAITPVPGGVGPMTIACLLANTLSAASRRAGMEPPGLL